MIRTYTDLLKLPDFKSRLDYLILEDYKYNSPRDISMKFFKSHTWRTICKEVIFRDLGFDLAVNGVYIEGKRIVHHMNPITAYDIEHLTDIVTNPEYLITTSLVTHNIIHYGHKKEEQKERAPGDTIFW